MSGLDSALARMGAIERMVSGVRPPALVANASGATSFADALDQATLIDAGTTQTTVVAAAPTAATRTPATASPSRTPSVSLPDRRTPPAGDPSYRPAHVTETDERVWNDCTWASAAMWIDKLTGGEVKVDREALRAASGDRTGGSSLGDVVRGARKLLGLDLRAAHDERLTVDGLLDRLAAGGGAIVQGSYASLPSKLTRHDPGFAAKGVAGSGHAVYVGPLDRSTGKVWWDDPLAPAGGSGQWISVKDLRAFMWTDSRGRVSALATPGVKGATSATSATSAAASNAGTGARTGSTTREAASIAAAAWTAGVDPLLLTAYVDATSTRSDAGAIAGRADELAAALARDGQAGIALENLGAAQGGAVRRAGGATFASDVLREWAELLGRPAGG